MRGLGFFLAAFLVFSGRSTLAHERAPQHSVLVQVERNSAVVLVSWLAGDDDKAQLSARTLWSKRSAAAKRAVRTLLANQALDALEFTLDGESIRHRALKTKVIATPKSGLAVAILFVVDIGKSGGRLEVRAVGKSAIRTKWLRTMAQPVSRPVSSNLIANRWHTDWHTLSLLWSPQ